MQESAIVDAPSIEQTGDSEDNSVWVEALGGRVYHTPQYGAVPISLDKFERMIKNFNDNVRGQEIAIDFDHGFDRAKGNQASGWYKEFAIRPSSDDPEQKSLYARIELTEDAKKEVLDKKWKYFSLEWDDEWINNDGEYIYDVITGGALTNRPIAKGMMPVNFSESLWALLDEDTQKQFAVWSTAFVNDLPDSCFLYVESGGKKDSEGKTTPRGLRHLPYKGPNGSIDLPHLRNAIARIPQMKGISDSLKSSLQGKARRLLGGKSKAASESVADATMEAYDLLVAQGFDVEFSEAPWEHSEPGTGPTPQYDASMNQPDPGTGQYVPRQQGDIASDDPAIGGGWRREPLPVSSDDPTQPVRQQPGMTVLLSEGGESVLTDDERNELMKLLGVEDEEQFMPEARKAFGELKTFKETVGQTTQEREFAEQYPAVWREHMALLDANRTSQAKQFSESIQRIKRPEGDELKPTRNGLSALALDKVAEVHKKFSEGTATQADFEDAVRAITDGGIVEFGEVGSSQEPERHEIDTGTATGVAAARRMFAEKVAEVQKSDSEKFGDFREAVKEASRLYPDLAAGYRATAS